MDKSDNLHNLKKKQALWSDIGGINLSENEKQTSRFPNAIEQ
jgi:hypothetical protein